MRGALLPAGLASIVYWTIDMLLSFIIGFMRQGELVLQQPAVCKHYFRTSFGLDAFLVVSDWANFTTSVTAARLEVVSDSSLPLRLSKVTRLLKVLRIFRLFRTLDKISAGSAQSSVRVMSDVVKVTCGTLLLCHLLACSWFLVGVSGPTDTGLRWLDTPMDGRNVEIVTDADLVHQYALALHWVVAQLTLGASDVFPENVFERFINIVLLLVGVLFGASIVAFLSAQIVQFMMSRQDKMRVLSNLQSFVRQHQVPRLLAARLRGQVVKRLKEEKMLYEADVDALQLLSSSLRAELVFATRKPHVLTHALFQTWDQLDWRAVRSLCETAVGFAYPLPKDELFVPGPALDRAYYVVRGKLLYWQFPETSKLFNEESTDVVDGAWLCEAALWSEWFHVGLLEAATRCHVVTVSGSGLAATLDRSSSAIASITATYAQNFHTRLSAAMPPHADWPSDLGVPFCSPTDLLSSDVGIVLVRQALKAGDLPADTVAMLEQELRDGLCAVQLAADTGKLERVVSLVTLSLGDGQGRTLVQVGKWEPSAGAKPRLQLPGLKRPTQEMPKAALQRLLGGHLRPLAGFVMVEDCTNYMERKESADYGVSTTYLRMEYKAVLAVDTDQLQLPVAPLLREPDIPSLGWILPRSVYTLTSGSSAQLFAWLSTGEVDYLEAPGNLESLRGWISLLVVAGLDSEDSRPLQAHLLGPDYQDGQLLPASGPGSDNDSQPLPASGPGSDDDDSQSI